MTLAGDAEALALFDGLEFVTPDLIRELAVPIIARSGDVADARSANPLDLTFSKLRAVAPVHIEYLNNMGVGASMSISPSSLRMSPGSDRKARNL